MWAIAVLATLAALVIGVLCLPLDMVLQADVNGKPGFRLRLSWLFGLVTREIAGKKERPVIEHRPAKRRKKRRRGDIRVIFKILRTRGVFSHFRGLLKDILSCLKFQDLVADFKIGLGDPADTALLFAIIGPASVFLGSSHRHEIRLEPSFGTDAILQGYSRGTVRLLPIQLCLVILKFIFSLTTIKVVRTLISSRWQRKK